MQVHQNNLFIGRAEIMILRHYIRRNNFTLDLDNTKNHNEIHTDEINNDFI